MKLLSKNNLLTVVALAAITLVISAAFLSSNNTNPSFSVGTEIVFAGGGGGGGGGGGAEACGPSASGDTSGMSGGCGCDGNAGVGGGDGDGDGDGDGGTPHCTTFSCISAANICGDISTGTQNSCTGICSAGVPANPSGSCSVATECGVNATGFNGCSGGCNITRYPFCTTVQNPDGDGEIEWITIGGDGNGDGSGYGATDILAEIFANPILVAQGTPTVIRWLSIETDSCEVSAPNGDSWTGTTGEELTSDIEEEITYTLTCEGYEGTTFVDSVKVRVVPEWQEF